MNNGLLSSRQNYINKSHY